MKIIHFTYSITGGAGIVVNKFHHLLKKNNYSSAIINIRDHVPHEDIYIVKALRRPVRKILNFVRYVLFRLYVRLQHKKSKQHNFTYDYNYAGITLNDIKESLPFKPDIIFLHWISDFILPSMIKELHDYYQCPVIWRYNDLTPVTGGCHYLAGCDNYKTSCGYCPAIGSSKKNDWSYRQFKKKEDVLSGIDITVINSTFHTEEVFKSSKIFETKRQVFIRNSLPLPANNVLANKSNLRVQLGIPLNKKVIFWGATHITETRKGFLFFVQSLAEIAEKNDWFIIIAGNKPDGFNPGITFEHRFTGLLNEKDLITYYQASDVVTCTSLEDGGPMMIVEALMNGTPVVSFATGLALELVITGKTGYLAEKANAKDLAKGLLYLLNLPPEEYESVSYQCKQKAISLYGEKTEIEAYKTLFAELLEKKSDERRS